MLPVKRGAPLRSQTPSPQSWSTEGEGSRILSSLGYFHFHSFPPLPAMASADLRKELECSICLDIYMDPVTLKCGHNFCRDCISRALDTQEGSGGYSCPECRQKVWDRPALQGNTTLRNIVENFFHAALPDDGESKVLCTYCVDFPAPAVRSCLHCEVSLCNKHMKVHTRSSEHVLTDPMLFLESRKCPVHKKILEYYCAQDDACVCASCCLFGGHKGHDIESLDGASGKKINKMRGALQKLTTRSAEMEERIRSLQQHWKDVEEKAAGGAERVSALFGDLRRHLEDLEEKALEEITVKSHRVFISITELIRDLVLKKEELSEEMRHIEELCNRDPLTVLQESDDLRDTEDGENELRERLEKLLHEGDALDVAGIVHSGLSDIITEVNVYIYLQEPEDVLLDVKTAENSLRVSSDGKTVSISDTDQNRPETPERFQSWPQVLSSRSFSSGRHYWEVDVGGSDSWIFGMCYPSIDRGVELQSLIGYNSKSWGLDMDGDQYGVRHDGKQTLLPANISSNRVRIYLDYEAGRISFYDLCDPIQHLYTFTTNFTEPLHAGLGVWRGSVTICGGGPGDVRTPPRDWWHPK
ncbi:E3 ubiquitin-protein ligase TRIM21-like [Rana temporaria]|uniref:E3 ubiquitin-protein ligase TRIM21-like n=1 Tax=Rana temporaria TaxID=8407 RepID=UPI001AAC4CF1|nr:E3 ubiquitin-protein ligase TRIM21-like [Rana temporaria]